MKKLGYTLILLLGMTACHSGQKDSVAEVPEQETSVLAGGDAISFTEEQARVGGVGVEEVKVGKFHEVIKTSGQVLSFLDDEMWVVAPQDGMVRLAGNALTEGCTVKEGDALFYISGAGLADGDAAKLTQLEYETALESYQRGVELARDQIISQVELNKRKLRYESASARLLQHGALGVRANAPISGNIRTLSVTPGAFVRQGDVLAVITRNQKLQLRAEVSEKYYSHLSQIRGANFRLIGQDTTLRLSDMGGRLVSYSRSTAQDMCFVPVIFEFNNTTQMVVGSFADVYLLGEERPKVISLPITALTEEMGLYYAYVQVSPESYQKREVKLGDTDGVRYEIRLGLQEGERVVTRGVTLIKLAAMSGNIPHGHSAEH